MLEEKLHDPKWSAEILRIHGPQADEARGIVGTLNYAWQVWRLEGDRVRVSVYAVRGVPNADVPAVLARLAFPKGGKLRRRSGYAYSFDVL